MVRNNFSVGDLVFAKVKGYPAWPARITAITEKGRYSVFFYGTYENATVKHTELFKFSKENQDNFIPKNINRKNYGKGIEEIRNTPEIAPGHDEDHGEDLVHTPVQKVEEKMIKPVFPQPGLSTLVRKPLRLSDGTALTPGGGGTPTKAERATPGGDTKRRGIKRPAEELESEEIVRTPSGIQHTSSRSGRVIKHKRFSDEVGREGDQKVDQDPVKPRADLQIDDPRKIWVKKRSTGDLIEIQLDKEKPERWESHEQKLTWLLSTARNATKLKKYVELGEYIPSELVESLKLQSQLSPEDKDQLRKVAEQGKRRQKMSWLLREHELVDTDIGIKRSLQCQNPDTDECIRMMQSFIRMDIDKLMLVKQPLIIDTLRKLQRYEGPADTSRLAEKDKERLKRNVNTIHGLAETTYRKLQALFKFRESGVTQFSDFVQQEVQRFNEMTKHMEPSRKLALTQFPQ